MHAIIICNTPSFVGAGRQLLAAIHNLPVIIPNLAKLIVLTMLQVVFTIRSSTPRLPRRQCLVPAQKRVRTINRREGLAMLEGRKEGSSRSRGNRSFSGLAQAPSLKRVRTINQLEGLGMIECQNTLLAERESGSWAQALSLINFLKM